MKILIHDFGGYAFTSQLAAHWASQGLSLTYAYCSELTNTPTAGASVSATSNLTIEAVSIPGGLDKSDLIARWRQENRYGESLVQRVRTVNPDVILSANAPLDVQKKLLRWSNQNAVPFIFWVQDLIGLASREVLAQRMPFIGTWIGEYYRRLETFLLRKSSAAVLISEDFRQFIDDPRKDSEVYSVIENWAPLPDLPVLPRQNPWSTEQGLATKTCIMYTGNLGRKHDPLSIVKLAEGFGFRDDVELVVVSQGEGADWLRKEVQNRNLMNLRVLPFQPTKRLPEVLATADILLSVLTKEAAAYSVPSKVLTYLCSGRPLLMAIPHSNRAAKMVLEARAGAIVEPRDYHQLYQQALLLVSRPDVRATAGQRGRNFAENTFNIDSIGYRFTQVIDSARRNIDIGPA